MALLKRKKKQDATAAEDAETPAAATPAESAEEGEALAGKETKIKALLKNKKKLLIIFICLLVAGAIILGALYITGVVRFYGSEEDDSHARREEGAHQGAGEPIYYEVPQILVNLNTGGKQTSFIKVTVTLELHSSLDLPVVTANLPRLLDSYNTFLREMRATDLYGSAGAYRLREEMLMRANKVLAPLRVKDVLFKELIIQ